jgi:hypothetical protein
MNQQFDSINNANGRKHSTDPASVGARLAAKMMHAATMFFVSIRPRVGGTSDRLLFIKFSE